VKVSHVVAIGALLGASVGAAQSKKVLVTGLRPEAVGELKASAPGLRLVTAENEQQLAAEAADAEAILGAITPKLLAAGKQLKWVQVYTAGVERYLTPELRASPVVLTNCKIIQGPNIADHAMALLLALTRNLNRTWAAQAREEWTRGDYRFVELPGKTAVIIGLGGIGMQIAQRASAFGMRVIGVDPKDISYTSLVAKVVPPDRLNTVLPEADVVFVSAPLTPQSQGMMGPRQFDLMKKGAYFIAVSRGKLYNTEALVKALDSRQLAGAGLDVTDPEPLPKGHPLWKFPNVLITPHVAGQSDRVQERRMALLKENLQRFAAGEPLLNMVDKQKGY
jgi:phosphoglycerate dehydrogenase-like enzyme